MTREDYIFVCYSHADEDVIAAEIDWLEEQGYSVWYDARIPGGAEWNDELARRIQDCEWFLYFISPSSVGSAHCRNELNYAQQHGRRMLAIEIEPTEVPAGMQLMLNARQFLFRHRLPKGEYRRRLADALELESEPAAQPPTRAVPSPGPRSRKRTWLTLTAGAVLVIAALAAVLMRFQATEDLEFRERDWVVVGNLQNRTQDPKVGEALDTSLRIALEQSKFASVLPAASIRAAKQRMQLDPDAPLEREGAIELAEREDAKAGIVGNITELGGSYTISVEIIDPSDGATAWAGSVRAENLDKVLPAIDKLSREVRERLGESLSSIEASSMPLAKVTTPNLEALRAYSLAEKSVAAGDWEAGLELLQRAVEIDPEFAMAHGKIAAIYIAWALQPERAAKHYELALQNKSRLSPREQLYIEASSAWFKTPAEMRRAWKSMSVMFPNEAVGFNNLGEVLRRYYLDFEGAAAQFRASSELRAPWQYMAFYNLGQSLLGQDRNEEALQALQTAYEMGGNPVKYVMADAYTVLRRYEDALEFLSTAGQTESPTLKQEAQFRRLGLLADRGEIDRALELTARMLSEADGPGQLSRVHAARVALLERGTDPQPLRAALNDALQFELVQLERAPEVMATPVLSHLAILAREAVRGGAPELAEDAIAAVRENVPGNGFPVDQAWLELLQAEIRLQQGDATAALEHAERSIDHAELFQAHETLARIYAELGDAAARTAELQWMQSRRGRAFAEVLDWSYGSYGQLFNILDWSRADQALAGMPSPPTANAPSVIPSTPSARSMSISLQAAVKNAPSPRSAHTR